MKILHLSVVVGMSLAAPTIVSAHSGGLDANGPCTHEGCQNGKILILCDLS
jgi:hypothetical protein